jgi:HEPN domain-containing protein
LALAQQRRSRDVLRATLCFHAQQAAEKALKAVLVSKRVAFPFQHNLAHLVSLVEDAGIAWPDELDAVVELTQYAVESRYPCLPGDASPRALRRALRLAAAVLSWAEKTVKHRQRTRQ